MQLDFYALQSKLLIKFHETQEATLSPRTGQAGRQTKTNANIWPQVIMEMHSELG